MFCDVFRRLLLLLQLHRTIKGVTIQSGPNSMTSQGTHLNRQRIETRVANDVRLPADEAKLVVTMSTPSRNAGSLMKEPIVVGCNGYRTKKRLCHRSEN